MTNRATKSASFTRPANTTAYSANDLVANNVTAGSVAALAVDAAARFPGGNGTIRAVQLEKSTESVTNAQFRVHLFTAAPTSLAGDNAAYDISNGMAKGYLGYVDVTMNQQLGDGAFGRADCDIDFDTVAPANDIYGLVEALAAYTPASAEIFTLKLELDRD